MSIFAPDPTKTSLFGPGMPGVEVQETSTTRKRERESAVMPVDFNAPGFVPPTRRAIDQPAPKKPLVGSSTADLKAKQKALDEAGLDQNIEELPDTVALAMFFLNTFPHTDPIKQVDAIKETANRLFNNVAEHAATRDEIKRQISESGLYVVQDQTSISELIMDVVEDLGVLRKAVEQGHFVQAALAYDCAITMHQLHLPAQYLAFAVSNVMYALPAHKEAETTNRAMALLLRDVQKAAAKTVEKQKKLSERNAALEARLAETVDWGFYTLKQNDAVYQAELAKQRKELQSAHHYLNETSLQLKETEAARVEDNQRSANALSEAQKELEAAKFSVLEQEEKTANALDQAEQEAAMRAVALQELEQAKQQVEVERENLSIVASSAQTQANRADEAERNLAIEQERLSNVANSAQMQANRADIAEVSIAKLSAELDAFRAMMGQTSQSYDSTVGKLKSELQMLDAQRSGLVKVIEERESHIKTLQSDITSERTKVQSLLEASKPSGELENLRTENAQLKSKLDELSKAPVPVSTPIPVLAAEPAVSTSAPISPAVSVSMWNDPTELEKARAKAAAWWASHPLGKKRDLELKNQKVVTSAAEYVPGKTDFPGVDLGSKIIKRKTKKS